jgi:hypothetical protein
MRTLYCHGGMLPLAQVKAWHAAAGWTAVDYLTVENEEVTDVSFRDAIAKRTSVVVEDSLLAHGMLGPPLFTEPVTALSRASQIETRTLKSLHPSRTQVMESMRQVVRKGGLVAIIVVEGILEVPMIASDVFDLEWQFNSCMAAHYFCQPAAEPHFSERERVRFHYSGDPCYNLTVPEEEAMWAEMLPVEDSDGTQPDKRDVSALPPAELRIASEVNMNEGISEGLVGGVPIAVHVSSAGGRVAWFGDGPVPRAVILLEDLVRSTDLARRARAGAQKAAGDESEAASTSAGAAVQGEVTNRAGGAAERGKSKRRVRAAKGPLSIEGGSGRLLGMVLAGALLLATLIVLAMWVLREVVPRAVHSRRFQEYVKAHPGWGPGPGAAPQEQPMARGSFSKYASAHPGGDPGPER